MRKRDRERAVAEQSILDARDAHDRGMDLINSIRRRVKKEPDAKGDKPEVELDSRGLDKNRHKLVEPTAVYTIKYNLFLIIKGINGPGTANPSTPYSKDTLITKIKALDKKETANRTMSSDILMEKYTRLLLLPMDTPGETLRLPKDIVLYVPILKRLNEMSDDEIKRHIFPLFIPVIDGASTKASLAFNELTSPEAIRHKMFQIILKHPEREQKGWGLTNDTIVSYLE